MAWAAANKKHPHRGGTVIERFDTPLAFEPGTSWMYGPSIDFAGLLVERISGETLEAYLKTHFLAPIGATDITFHLSTRPDMQARRAPYSYRTAGGRVSATPDNPADNLTPFLDHEGNEVTGCLGGQGIFASAGSYIKVLRGVLDGSLVPAPFADAFFSPQLDQAQANALNALLQLDMANNAMGNSRKSVRKNWGLGGVLLEDDDHEKGRKAGTIAWGGLPMQQWFVDRKTDLCGFFMTQIVPVGDQKAAEVADGFVTGVYRLVAEGRKSTGRL